MIELQRVTKRFSNGKGVFDLNLVIQPGEVFGYIGPNGAGKSTTIRQLMGFIRPDEGIAKINGFHCWTQASDVHRQVGYLPGEIALMDGMTGSQFLQLMERMRGNVLIDRKQELIERFQFDVKTPIRKMSKGMKQKVGIVTAFMHDPDIYVLDEPTSGLDPLMQKAFIDLILEEKQRGKTILLSSHIFHEVEQTCDRVGMIQKGKLIAVRDIYDLRQEQRKIYVITLEDFAESNKLVEAGFSISSKLDNTIEVEVQGDVNRLIQVLSTCAVRSLGVHYLQLEELFLEYYDQKAEGVR